MLTPRTGKNTSAVDVDVENNTINTLKKPLIDYNLAQAYVRYEVNAERLKQIPRPKTKDQQQGLF